MKKPIGFIHAQKKLSEITEIIWSSCPSCDHDEAEGGVVNHCDACCRRIVTKLHELFQK